MAVKMGAVQMGGYDDLISLTQEPPGKFYTQSVRLFWGDFAGSIRVDDMIPLDAICLAPTVFCGPHFGKSCLWEAVDAVHELPFREQGLGGIAGVLNAAVQPVANDDDLIRCHYRSSFTRCQAS